MKIAVVTTDKVGISTTLVGKQVIEALEGLGHAVEVVYTDGREGTPVNVKPLKGLPVVCLLEHKTAAILDQVRYSRPLCVLSVWTGNVEGYADPFLLGYGALFDKPKFSGVPVCHVSHSRHTEFQLRERLSDWLRSSRANQIASNCRTHLYGISTVFEPGDNDPDRLVAPMNRFVNSSKNVTLHAELTGKYQAWAAIKGLTPLTRFYHAPEFGPEGFETRADLSAYAIEQQPDDFDDYVANARRTGMFLCVSNFESFGIYYLELLMAGAVGVFLDRPWVRRLLPDYPYVTHKAGLVGMMGIVRERYDRVRQEQIETIIPKLRDTYSLSKFAAGLVGEIERLLP
jgi:hypothetical protein